MTSKNQKRRAAREAAHRLRKKNPDWDPTKFKAKDPIEKLRELESEQRSKETYEGSTGCEACAGERQKSGDETALCEKHLAEAMGF